MKIKIIGNTLIEGEYNLALESTLKEIFVKAGGLNRPRLIQVGGALGKLFIGEDINRPLSELEDYLYEPNLAYYQEHFCPVDYMRFMVRFTIRELNIVNKAIRKIFEILDKMTINALESYDYEIFLQLIKASSDSKGEAFLKRNLLYICEHFEKEVLEHVQGFCGDHICQGLFEAQCINACPGEIHIPGFVALMKAGKVSEAYQLMRKRNPLSSVCGSVCARPCEIACRRGQITSTVGVRGLQRFISNTALDTWDGSEACLADNNQSVGIVGGGPAGLTAAYYLRRSGYKVTIYEQAAQAGGMLAFGVPAYRLPLKSIEEEVRTIEALGIDIRLNTKVDGLMYKALIEEHDRLILATGATLGNKLPVAHHHTITGIDFLKSVRLDASKAIGKKTVVIGGGDVALDCARTAKRLGAEVSILSLEMFDDLPASTEEKLEAVEEGVYFKSGFSVNRVEADDLYLNKCVNVFDDAGRFKPCFESSTEVISNVDTVILCVGQRPDLSYLNNEKNDLKSLQEVRLHPHAFTCGDMVKPTIVIDAIAQGRMAAELLDKDLGGRGLFTGEEIEIPEKLLNITTFDHDLRQEAMLSVKDRVTNFDEVSKVYTLEDALYEANRCMRCDRNSKKPLLLGR